MSEMGFQNEKPGHDEAVTGPRFERAGPQPTTEPAAHLVLGYRAETQGGTVLQIGAHLATRLTAALHVVHVVDLSDYPIDPDSATWEREAEATLAAEQRAVQTALADQPTSWTYYAGHGDPVTLLRQIAEGNDALMFIVGSRGEGGATLVSRLLGAPSVSHGLIAHSHRPVLVVPPAADPAYRRAD